LTGAEKLLVDAIRFLPSVERTRWEVNRGKETKSLREWMEEKDALALVNSMTY
jgi:hypothetical protein